MVYSKEKIDLYLPANPKSHKQNCAKKEGKKTVTLADCILLCGIATTLLIVTGAVLSASGAANVNFVQDGMVQYQKIAPQEGVFLIPEANAQTTNTQAENHGITVSDPEIVNSRGDKLNANNIKVDQRFAVASVVENKGDQNQEFAYMVQIKNAKGQIEHFEGISASALPGQSFNAALTWTPDVSGKYDIEVFVWNSFSNPVPLSDKLSLSVDVGTT